MSKFESADLILKLYDLRREEKMREARNWISSFFPESAEDILMVMINPATSGYFRMVTTYWDMAASLVNHGAIDEEMFNDTTGEHIMVFAKVEPYLAEVRQGMGGVSEFLKNLETLIMKRPDAKEILASRREMIKRWMKARSEMAQSA